MQRNTLLWHRNTLCTAVLIHSDVLTGCYGTTGARLDRGTTWVTKVRSRRRLDSSRDARTIQHFKGNCFQPNNCLVLWHCTLEASWEVRTQARSPRLASELSSNTETEGNYLRLLLTFPYKCVLRNKLSPSWLHHLALFAS